MQSDAPSIALKTCKDCFATLPLSEFYTKKTGKDGYSNRCKTCMRLKVAANRRKKIDHYREYEKRRRPPMSRTAQSRAYRESVLNDPQKHERDGINRREREKYNRDKKRAHGLVKRAIVRGSLFPKPCERCGALSNSTQAHHEDYRFPLTVNWLCNPCHARRHAEIRAQRLDNYLLVYMPFDKDSEPTN